ncbi:MAG: pilus assembly protein PilP [Gammaproteobacteria bacterium]|nr:MAG: pilus assembly protein PilP [Gammaproteobacteria bacterium]
MMVRVLSLLVLTLVLAACGTRMRDLDQYVADVKSRTFGQLEPLPEIRPYETFTYDAYDLRDPFTPSSSIMAERRPSANGLRPNFDRRREPLEAFPLDALRMVGTLERSENQFGLIQDATGLVHRVQPGNYIGQNYGEITSIAENKIQVLEIVADGLGGWMERDAGLNLTD